MIYAFLVFVVAIVALAGTAESEAPELAQDLGIGAYEAGQLLRGGTPFVTMRTGDRRTAVSHLDRLRLRGHEAVGFDAESVVSSANMGEVKGFAFEGEGIRFQLRGRPDDFVSFDDFVCFVRAVHRTSERVTTKTRERSFDFKKFAISGGIAMTKVVEKESSVQHEEREPVVYLFRRTSTPILFCATRAKYLGLGPDVRPTQLENFERTLASLREKAPHAPYDDRLVGLRRIHEKVTLPTRGQEVVSSAQGVDLLAHVVAMTVSRAGANPYRERR